MSGKFNDRMVFLGRQDVRFCGNSATSNIDSVDVCLIKKVEVSQYG